MATQLKKIIAMISLIALVIVYALVAIAIASANFAASPWWVHLLYFLFTGLLWIVPAMFIVRYMIKLPRE